jgi:hypothetical protein
MHPRPCVKLVGHRTDDPQAKFPVSAGNSAVE